MGMVTAELLPLNTFNDATLSDATRTLWMRQSPVFKIPRNNYDNRDTFMIHGERTDKVKDALARLATVIGWSVDMAGKCYRLEPVNYSGSQYDNPDQYKSRPKDNLEFNLRASTVDSGLATVIFGTINPLFVYESLQHEDPSRYASSVIGDMMEGFYSSGKVDEGVCGPKLYQGEISTGDTIGYISTDNILFSPALYGSNAIGAEVMRHRTASIIVNSFR